jgi:hypothetical protein
MWHNASLLAVLASGADLTSPNLAASRDTFLRGPSVAHAIGVFERRVFHATNEPEVAGT